MARCRGCDPLDAATARARDLERATLTNHQFNAIASLIRAKAGPTQEAARSVLVNGLTALEASRAHGVNRPLVYAAVRRFKRAWDKIRSVSW